MSDIKSLDKIISEEEFDNMMSVERRLTKMISPDMIDIDPSEFDPRDVTAPGAGSKYSVEDKIYACIVYTTTGSPAKTQNITNIPISALSHWRKQDWFLKVAEQVKKIRNDFLEAQLTHITEKATDAILDRLEHGDETYDMKTGEHIRIKVKASDATAALKTALEKREELGGREVAGKERSSIVDHLKRLADAFEEVSKVNKLPIIESEVVDVEIKA